MGNPHIPQNNSNSFQTTKVYKASFWKRCACSLLQKSFLRFITPDEGPGEMVDNVHVKMRKSLCLRSLIICQKDFFLKLKRRIQCWECFLLCFALARTWNSIFLKYRLCIFEKRRWDYYCFMHSPIPEDLFNAIFLADKISRSESWLFSRCATVLVCTEWFEVYFERNYLLEKVIRPVFAIINRN